MSEELNKLKIIGAQKIYETTHIALKHVKNILDENFEDMTKVQFIGFVSILEKEYRQDLSTLKTKGLEFFAKETTEATLDAKFFMNSKNKKNYTSLYIIIALVIFGFAIYKSMDFETVSPSFPLIDNTTINVAKSNLLTDKMDSSDVNETNSTPNEESRVERSLTSEEENNISTVSKKAVVTQEEVQKEEKSTLPSLILMPQARVWVGYINKSDNKNNQTVTSKNLVLDPNKEWLVSLGHGKVIIEVNGERFKYNSSNSMRFRYKDNKITTLSIAEFKALNKGRLW